MGNLSIFQVVLIAGFVLAAIVGLILFATGFGAGGGRGEQLPEVVIWGSIDGGIMDTLIRELVKEDDRFTNVQYEEKDVRTYDEDFVEALASGRGPDLFFVSESNLLKNQDKIITVPFNAYSERMFRNTFVEVGELFLTRDGVLALPFVVDPLVMYWNRDLLGSEGIAQPPAFWDEFFTLSPKITERDQSSNILRSFVAFGEFRNVVHVKDIVSALILQTGNPLVGFDSTGRAVSTLGERYDFVEPPALSALRFYTEFSNPVKSVYSWNRALPDSKQSFISGDLAIYMGFASEFTQLRAANPNLNFDVAVFPQSRDASAVVTFAHVNGLAIPRSSRDAKAAFTVAGALTSTSQIARLNELLGLPPVRRDLLEDKPTDVAGPVFYTSAIVARSWLDPDSVATDSIYQQMIESTLSGRASLNEAVNSAEKEVNNLLR